MLQALRVFLLPSHPSTSAFLLPPLTSSFRRHPPLRPMQDAISWKTCPLSLSLSSIHSRRPSCLLPHPLGVTSPETNTGRCLMEHALPSDPSTTVCTPPSSSFLRSLLALPPIIRETPHLVCVCRCLPQRLADPIPLHSLLATVLLPRQVQPGARVRTDARFPWAIMGRAGPTWPFQERRQNTVEGFLQLLGRSIRAGGQKSLKTRPRDSPKEIALTLNPEP